MTDVKQRAAAKEFVNYWKDMLRRALVDLFKILDTKPEDSDPYLADDSPELAAFPYVNGGLFADENIEIPPFTDDIRVLLLEKKGNANLMLLRNMSC